MYKTHCANCATKKMQLEDRKNKCTAWNCATCKWSRRALASQTKVTRVTFILSVLLAALMNPSESFHVVYSFTRWIILKIFSINIFQNIRQRTFSQWRHWTSASPHSSKCKCTLTLTLSLTAGSSTAVSHTLSIHSLHVSSMVTRFLSIQMLGWSGSIMVDQKRNWPQRRNTVGAAA